MGKEEQSRGREQGLGTGRKETQQSNQGLTARLCLGRQGLPGSAQGRLAQVLSSAPTGRSPQCPTGSSGSLLGPDET